ncbi:MAG: ferredoxin family protein [Synergistaceae bacterium]|nr:ferredoxin family protein [Synergistaceae bacterium]
MRIDPKRCKGCGLCADFCPRNIYDFSWGSVPVAARSDDCVGCMQCEVKCPELAITVREAAP